MFNLTNTYVHVMFDCWQRIQSTARCITSRHRMGFSKCDRQLTACTAK